MHTEIHRHNGPAPAGARINELVALERFGTRLQFSRNQEIYAEGDAAMFCYRVVSGAVRLCKVLADGRRHIAEFCLAGDFFAIKEMGNHPYSAEAVNDVTVIRYPRAVLERVAEQHPDLARRLHDMTSADLAAARAQMLLLGRMTSSERVASFLLDLADRVDCRKSLDLPMSRYDIADYLGLTIETVSRTLSTLKRLGVIALPTTHRIELLDRRALEAVRGA